MTPGLTTMSRLEDLPGRYRPPASRGGTLPVRPESAPGSCVVVVDANGVLHANSEIRGANVNDDPRVSKSWGLALSIAPLVIDVIFGVVALIVWPSSSSIPHFVLFFSGMLAGVILWGLVFPAFMVLVLRKRR